MSITREEFFDYVKKSQGEIMNDTQTYSQSTRHYLKRFDKHGHKRFFLSWNWAGFFFTFMWMAYRKLFMITLLSYFLLNISVVMGLFFLDSKLAGLFFCIAAVVYIFSWMIPLVADSLYISHIKRLKKKEKKPKKKPVSWLAAIVFYAMILAASVFLGEEMVLMVFEPWGKSAVFRP